MSPTLAEARRKEQEQHKRDCETARAVILRDQPDHADELMEALGLAEYEQVRGPKKAMRRTVTTAEVLALYDAGHSPTAIGRILGIARSTVWHHIHKVQR